MRLFTVCQRFFAGPLRNFSLHLWRWAGLFIGVVIVAGLALYFAKIGPGEGVRAQANTAERLTRQGQSEAAVAVPLQGLHQGDDFQVVVPPGWARRPDLEDDGPGTKLFLVGPPRAGVNLVVGVDVYPLRTDTTLDHFTSEYSQRWAGQALVERNATLCQQPCRQISLTEGTVEKLFLLMVWRDKGFIISLVGPSGQTALNKAEYQRLMDSFQVYE